MKNLIIVLIGIALLTGCGTSITGLDNKAYEDTKIETCADCSDDIIRISNTYGTADRSRYINDGGYWKWTWTYYSEDGGSITDVFTFEEDPESIECCGFTHRQYN